MSSGRLGLGLGDSQELKKDWMKGSRCCPFCHKKKNTRAKCILGGYGFKNTKLTFKNICIVKDETQSTSYILCPRINAFLTSFISLLGTDLMIFPVKNKKPYLSDVCFCHVVPLFQTHLFSSNPRSAWSNISTGCLNIIYFAHLFKQSVCHILCSQVRENVPHTVPRFTSGNILSRNWDSMLWGDRKSASSWLLLSSGCCRSFCKVNR